MRFTVSKVLLLIAFVVLILAAFSVTLGKVQLVPAGLALVVAAFFFETA